MRNKIHYLYRIFKTGFGVQKLLNVAKLELSYRLSVFGILTRWNVSPQYISIEPANVCNLHCPECPVGMRQTAVKPVFADLALIHQVVDELSPALMYATLYFQGEPLLNKKLPEMIQYAHKQRIFTSTSTNAQALNPEMARELVASGLDKLIISIDGSTQEVYEQYRVGGNLEKAISGVKNIIEWKKQLKSITPFVEIQFVVFKTNEHQMQEMKTLSKSLKADRLVFKTAQLYDFENGHKLLTSIDKYARYKKTENEKDSNSTDASVLISISKYNYFR